jgi:hypothetical protein
VKRPSCYILLTEVKFLVPCIGVQYIADSGIRLSYRPARLHRMAGRYDNSMPESAISPHSGTKNLATVLIDVISKILSCEKVKVNYSVVFGRIYTPSE